MSDIKKRVLIVDDEPDIGLTLKIILERYGFTVDTVANPLTALKNFKPGLYDSNFKALFLTALRELDDYDSLKKNVFPKMGERHYIQKPISVKDLLEQVHSMLN